MENILIVDDEEGMRIALSEALKRAGYRTSLSIDGKDALSKIRTSDYSMVITDMKMPKMSGIEVLREVKKTFPQLPVVMITAYGTVENAVEAMKQGAQDYILKPFSFENVVEVVRHGLSCRQTLSAPRREKPLPENGNGTIITKNKELLKLLKLAAEIAQSDSSVLIHGESGTGKELLARYIHEKSRRNDKPFIAVNCAAIPDNLLESELFGHEKGSFTGALSKKLGKFELASGGTLLLDEIGDMSITLQAKLLRVLQEHEIDRVGGSKTIPVDVRIISTTNVDLKNAVKENRFREDLFYRLNVIPLKLPPLRQRTDDIPTLAHHFLNKSCQKNIKHINAISPEALQALKKMPWNGNIRELQNVVERAVLLCRSDTIELNNLFIDDSDKQQECREESFSELPVTSIEEMEKKLISKALNETNGNRTHAARALGISIRTLRNKLKDYSQSGALSESF